MNLYLESCEFLQTVSASVISKGRVILKLTESPGIISHQHPLNRKVP